MSNMIGIVDYGLSNLTCVAAAVERVGFNAVVGKDSDLVRRADKIILPGVGAFGDAMANLRDYGLIEPLNEIVVGEGKPFLGICLGAQLVARESDEFGRHEGLGWIDAVVRRIEPGSDGLRVPHTGWDDVRRVRDCVLFDGIPDDALFYYTHSHGIYCEDGATVVGVCDYGQTITAAIQRGNIYATQFHPEKSQKHGLSLLENFLGKG